MAVDPTEPRHVGEGPVGTDGFPRTESALGATTSTTHIQSLKDSKSNIQDAHKVLPRFNGQGNDIDRHQTLHPHHYDKPQIRQEKIENPMLSELMKCSIARHQFWNATTTPPVTKQSLSELDISSIINNAKLRHDVNFDRELHFRPNLDGHKGQTKRDTQRGYWQAVTAELQLYRLVYGPFLSKSLANGICKDCQPRIPDMFKTIKEILKNLVPDRDQSDVDKHLDISVMLQEIEHGVCDFVSIARWLSHLLKRHCAPMRDEMVDRMVEKISKGEADLDAESISAGLCELFGVLEAMKLDVANHQIRHLRALLIEDTVNFEQKYHVSRMKRRRYNIGYARMWFLNSRTALLRIPLALSWPNRDIEVFCSSLLLSLLPNSTIAFPDTFILDGDRLRLLRAEVQDLMYENICCEILVHLLRRVGSRVNHTTKEAQMKLRKKLQEIIGDGRFLAMPVGNISVELVRHVLMISGSSAATDSELVDLTESWLQHEHSNPQRQHYHANNLMKELLEDLISNVEKYFTASPWDIFNTLVAPAASTQQTSVPGVLSPGPSRPNKRNDIMNRMTHIAVLHWRVWKDLVYNNDDFPSYDSSSSTGTSRPSDSIGPASRSPTPHMVGEVPVLSLQTSSPISANSPPNEHDQGQPGMVKF